MAIVGTGGFVKVDDEKVAEIKTWSLDLGAENLDITSFDSAGWKEFLAGLKEWSGSFEGNYVSGDTDGQKEIISAWFGGNKLTLSLGSIGTTPFTFSGDALFTLNFESPVEDVVSISIDFQGTGPLTIPA